MEIWKLNQSQDQQRRGNAAILSLNARLEDRLYFNDLKRALYLRYNVVRKSERVGSNKAEKWRTTI
ncbi:hypothetical protein CHI14_17435 [Paenibacillus sp. 7516]|nr:hypothetical protein CHI14_17435 [Paenibacillus sp. 7516]